jgi:hypothetical protein
MRESQQPAGLTMRWVPVTDSRGRTHLEASWTPAPEPLAMTQPPAPVHVAHDVHAA